MSMKIDARRPVSPRPAPKTEAAHPALARQAPQGARPASVRDGFERSSGGIVGPRAGSTFEPGKSSTPASVPAGTRAFLKLSSPLQSALNDFATKLGQQPGEALSKKDFASQLSSFLKDLKLGSSNGPSTPPPSAGGAAGGIAQGIQLSARDLKILSGKAGGLFNHVYGTYTNVKSSFSPGKFSLD